LSRWLFCSSRYTAVTTTSGLSLLIAASVGALSGGDPVRHAALDACVTLMVATIALIAWLVRAGSAVGFFSETVLVGFKVGLAFYLASTQLPKLFGFKGTQGDFWERSAYFIGHLSDTHRASVLPSVAALAVLIAASLDETPPGVLSRRRRRHCRGATAESRSAGRCAAG
jgi:MFS superfamily sulfate permease-like transporter